MHPAISIQRGDCYAHQYGGDSDTVFLHARFGGCILIFGDQLDDAIAALTAIRDARRAALETPIEEAA